MKMTHPFSLISCVKLPIWNLPMFLIKFYRNACMKMSRMVHCSKLSPPVCCMHVLYCDVCVRLLRLSHDWCLCRICFALWMWLMYGVHVWHNRWGLFNSSIQNIGDLFPYWTIIMFPWKLNMSGVSVCVSTRPSISSSWVNGQTYRPEFQHDGQVEGYLG